MKWAAVGLVAALVFGPAVAVVAAVVLAFIFLNFCVEFFTHR
jgi:hypothetical protein